MIRKRSSGGPAASPKVAVRSQLPWRTTAFLLAGGAVVMALIVGAGLMAGRDQAPSAAALSSLNDEVGKVRAQFTQVSAERDRLSAVSVQLDNQLKVDRAAQEQVVSQLKALENENARLKEDLAFFESLLPTPANSKDVVIRSFRLQAMSDAERDSTRDLNRAPAKKGSPDPRALRYRLLVQQSGRPERDFVGVVSLTVSLQQGGRPWVLQLPDATVPGAGPPPLSFRHYQRIEGIFELPEGAVVRSVLVKIEANGEVRAQQTFTM